MARSRSISPERYFLALGSESETTEGVLKSYISVPKTPIQNGMKNTVQYAVIGRADGHWSQLRKNFSGKYETGANMSKGEWFRAKLEIEGESLKVYVNGNFLLTVDPMLDGISKGSVGVWGWDSYFANFKYTPAK